MKKPKYILNHSKLKYFYLLTLISVWLLGVKYADKASFESLNSLHLSSEVPADVRARNVGQGDVPSYSSLFSQVQYKTNDFNPFAFANETGKQYEVQLELLRSEWVTLPNGQSQNLYAGDVVSVTVPSFIMNSNMDPASADLNQIVKYLNNSQGIPTPFGGFRNEVEIVESRDEKILGQPIQLRLANLSKAKTIKIRSIERAEEDDVIEESEGKIGCEDGKCGAKNNSFDGFASLLQKLSGENVDSMEDVMSSHLELSDVKRLLWAVKKGYSAKDGKYRNTGRTFRVKDGVISSSKQKCARGVKEALLAAGAVKNYLAPDKAKNLGPALVKEGFVNMLDYKNSTIKSPYDAPLGSVLVYKGGASGHTEIKTEKGFISDYFSPNARTGSAKNGMHGKGRILIGVYVKETPASAAWLAMQPKKDKRYGKNS